MKTEFKILKLSDGSARMWQYKSNFNQWVWMEIKPSDSNSDCGDTWESAADAKQHACYNLGHRNAVFYNVTGRTMLKFETHRQTMNTVRRYGAIDKIKAAISKAEQH